MEETVMTHIVKTHTKETDPRTDSRNRISLDREQQNNYSSIYFDQRPDMTTAEEEHHWHL